MKKFAVYRTETGYCCRRYCESQDDLQGTPFAAAVTDDRFPVVLDGSGGYYRFSAQDPGFCKVISAETDDPLPLEKMFFKNSPAFRLGWLSPDGDTYACGFTGHTLCAEKLAKRFFPDAKIPELTLGRAGWIKIIDSWDGTEEQHGQYVYSYSGRITKRQADTLYDLGLYRNEEVRDLIAACEQGW